MKGSITIEPLGSSHDRTTFSSGVAALDRYLRELATQDAKRRVSNCFVAVAPTASSQDITHSLPRVSRSAN